MPMLTLPYHQFIRVYHTIYHHNNIKNNPRMVLLYPGVIISPRYPLVGQWRGGVE